MIRSTRSITSTPSRHSSSSSDLIEYIGEITEAEKDAVLGGAYASLHSIDFPEPFGLTMAEAMATGTPVIAMRRGSTPEVVADGVTGFICDSIGEMIAAVERIPQHRPTRLPGTR